MDRGSASQIAPEKLNLINISASCDLAGPCVSLKHQGFVVRRFKAKKRLENWRQHDYMSKYNLEVFNRNNEGQPVCQLDVIAHN
jgi:hypothetical protein